MCYPNQGIRASLDGGRKPKDALELNYIIGKMANDYFANRGLCGASIKEVLGALEGAKLEVYRRVIAPYEDKKVISNGETFTCIPL